MWSVQHIAALLPLVFSVMNTSFTIEMVDLTPLAEAAALVVFKFWFTE